MSRVSRIIDILQAKRSEGALITELFEDYEKDNSINQIAHRIRDKLGGKEHLVVENGTWKLSEYAWTMSRAEMNQNLMLARLDRLDKKVNFISILLGVGAIISIVLIILLLATYNINISIE